MLFRMPMKTGRRAMPSHSIIHAFSLLALAFGAALAHAGEKPLTLSEALSRTMAQNPGLQVFDFRLQGLDGRRITADQNPALEAGLEVENFLGSDNLRGVDGAEYTLSLSSVLELGGKRQARVSVVDSRYGRVEAERRAETLDVLGQVTQRFVATLALQEKLQLAAEAVALAEATHEIVTRRADRGAAPQAEVLRARAALTQSRIEQSHLRAAYESRKMALDRVKTFTYIIQGLCVSFATIIYVPRLGSASASTGVLWELEAIAAVIIGGTVLKGGYGRIGGTILGALILTTIGNILNFTDMISNHLNGTMQGLIIIVAVLLQRSDWKLGKSK